MFGVEGPFFELSMGLWCGVWATYAWTALLQGAEHLRNGRTERGSLFGVLGLVFFNVLVLVPLYLYQPPDGGYNNELLAMGWLGAMALMSTVGLLCAWYERRRQRVANSQMATSTTIGQQDTEAASPATEVKKTSVDFSIFSRHRVTESKP